MNWWTKTTAVVEFLARLKIDIHSKAVLRSETPQHREDCQSVDPTTENKQGIGIRVKTGYPQGHTTLYLAAFFVSLKHGLNKILLAFA